MIAQGIGNIGKHTSANIIKYLRDRKDKQFCMCRGGGGKMGLKINLSTKPFKLDNGKTIPF